jgi:hypothetical protein
MKKFYRFSSLLLLTPAIAVITACHDKPIAGYGYLSSLELVNNPDFDQPEYLLPGNALIPSDDSGHR